MDLKELIILDLIKEGQNFECKYEKKKLTSQQRTELTLFAEKNGLATYNLTNGKDQYLVVSTSKHENCPDIYSFDQAQINPSLRFAAGAAPYFHDGRYATLFDLVSDPRSRMGHSASLPEADRRALAAYLESL